MLSIMHLPSTRKGNKHLGNLKIDKEPKNMRVPAANFSIIISEKVVKIEAVLSEQYITLVWSCEAKVMQWVVFLSRSFSRAGETKGFQTVFLQSVWQVR